LLSVPHHSLHSRQIHRRNILGNHLPYVCVGKFLANQIWNHPSPEVNSVLRLGLSSLPHVLTK
jgi:hypothetical protein